MGGWAATQQFIFTFEHPQLQRVHGQRSKAGRRYSGARGHSDVRIRLRGALPVQTSTAAAQGTSGFPVINYEPTGIRTDISMPEGEPVIVGTLSIGPSGDAIIVMASAKRTSVR